MTKFVPPQLSSILGTNLDAIDERELQALIGVAESDVLEYKSQHYDTTDGDKAELAADVACLANAAGGLLIVGMGEDNDTGEATGFVPLPVQPHGVEEDTRYRQVLASKVFPRLDVSMARVDVVGGSVLLVSVPPSPLSPHAVVRDGSLRYPVRDGRHRRWLHEWEVADAYRRRFDEQQAAAVRAGEVRAQLLELVQQIAVAGDADSDETSVWLTMAFSPDRAGRLRIDHDTVAATREWMPRVRTVPISYLARTLHPTAGFRSIDLTSHTGSQLGQSRLALTLASTGGGAGAIRLDHDPQANEFRQPSLAISDMWLFLGALALGELLGAHAIDRCGTGATATALVNLQVIGDDSVTLAHGRRHSLVQPFGRTRPHPASTPIGRRTVALDDMWPPSPGLVSACVDLLSDVTGPFGVPTPYQADRDGRIRRPYVDRGFRADLEGWADRHGIEVTDDTAAD